MNRWAAVLALAILAGCTHPRPHVASAPPALLQGIDPREPCWNAAGHLVSCRDTSGAFMLQNSTWRGTETRCYWNGTHVPCSRPRPKR